MSKLRELEKRLDKEPENLGLRVMLATAMREAGRQSEAVELYRSVAVAYRDQGRQQQAIAVCRSILEIAPADDRCHALLRELQGSTEQIQEDEILMEVGTPPPPEARGPKPPTIPPIINAGRAQTAPPRVVPIEDVLPGARTLRGTGLNAPPPSTRSSSRLDQTPLPVPLPYHVADPTTKSLKKLSEVDLLPTPDPDDDAKTKPGVEERRRSESGLAQAARKISSALIKTDNDLSAELDTRQRPRIESDELEKIAKPPPTVPVERLDLLDDAETGSPAETRNMRANTGDDDEPEGIPTLDNEEHDEPTRPRDTPLDLMIRMENEGPIGSAFFTPLPYEHRETVLRRFHRKAVKKGTTVIRQGEIGHSLVVVIKGQLEAKLDRKGGTVPLGAIGLGEFVGEGSLLARTPSPVQVYAATDCDLLVLPPRDFYEIAGAFPALWAELKDVAERRKRDLEMVLRASSP